MDFDLTDEQQEFRKTIREFVEEVIAPRAEEMDRLEELPLDIVKQMGDMGLFGLPFPEEYGGQGADFLTFCIAVEELARIDSSMAITLEAAVGLGANPIFQFGTEEQKQQWLVPMASGEILGAFGLTEPGGGSDAGATRTTAPTEDRRIRAEILAPDIQRSTMAGADFEKLQRSPAKSRQMTIIDAVIVVPLVSEPTVVTVEDLRHVAAGCAPLLGRIDAFDIRPNRPRRRREMAESDPCKCPTRGVDNDILERHGFPLRHRHFYSMA